MTIGRTPGLRGVALIALGLSTAAFGLFLLVGGVSLITLGGSWYFALAGIGFGVAGVLTLLRRALGTAVYPAVLVGTAIWAIWAVWDSGFAFWPLSSPLFALTAIAFLLVLLLPASRGGEHSEFRRPAYVLAGLIAVALGVTLYTALQPQPGHTADGASVPVPGKAVGPSSGGDWRDWGRTPSGTRYAPVDQITPETWRACRSPRYNRRCPHRRSGRVDWSALHGLWQQWFCESACWHG